MVNMFLCVCGRMWGVIDLGSPVAWNGCWREMFLERAHLLYNGKSTYLVQLQAVKLKEINYIKDCWWSVGGTVVNTTCATFHLCDLGSIPAQCSYQIKIQPWSHVRRVFPV